MFENHWDYFLCQRRKQRLRKSDLGDRLEKVENFVFPDQCVSGILNGSWNLYPLCFFKWGWGSRIQSGGSFWVWNVAISIHQYFCPLDPDYFLVRLDFFFSPKNWGLGFSNRPFSYLLDALSADGCSRSRAEGVTIEASGISLVNQCFGTLLPLNLGMRKQIIKQEGVVASLSFRATADLVSSLGCGPSGPAALGYRICKLICPPARPHIWIIILLTSTSSFQSVVELTLW